MSLEGLLSACDSTMKDSKVFTLDRGNLNELTIYPKALNEHQDNDVEVQDIVESGVIVAQIFRASANNIDTVTFTGESAEARTEIDDIESGTYANDPALQAVWVKAGTYKPNDATGTTDRDQSFQLNNNVAVYGGFAATETERLQRNWLSNVTVLSGAGGGLLPNLNRWAGQMGAEPLTPLAVADLRRPTA